MQASVSQSSGSKTFVACSSNSACDAVVPKLKNSNLMVVRAHALSLEWETLLKDYHAKQRSGKLHKADPLPDDYVPPVRPQKVQPALEIEGAEMMQGGVDGHEEDANQPDDNATQPGYELDGEAENFDEEPQGGEAEAEKFDEESQGGEADEFDELMLKVSLDLLKLSEQRYNERMAIFNPEDPRMVCLEVAIHTWVLKFSGIVDSEWSTKPTPEEVAAGKLDPWLEFRALYYKADRQNLNDLEWTKFKKLLTELSQAVLRAGDVIIATAVQGETDLLKNINFEQVIMDEISVATHAELLCCWRETEVLTIIGDGKQLPATVLTTAAQNPFVHVQSFGPFQRFSELGMPVFLLREVMRMSAGLEDVANTIFYDSKLISGPGTSLNDPKRAMPRRLRPFIRNTFPKLTPEPEGLTYPIFFDVRGTYVKEKSGSSRVNLHNVSFVIGLIQKLLPNKKKLRVPSSKIGIACPYAAQRRETRKGLSRAGIHDIRVGTSEFWQGKEAAVMIVDFVRAGNDNGSLGFLVKKERLSVLLSRQEQQLFVVGDITCCDADFAAALNPSLEASDPTSAIADPLADEIPPADTPATLDRRNAWVMKVLKWLQEHGRVSSVDMEEITEEYVTFPKEEEQEEVDLGGWGDADEEEKAEKEEDDEKKQEEQEKQAEWVIQEPTAEIPSEWS